MSSKVSLRDRQRTETRHLIHQAALRLFEQQGVDQTTVQQIADEVGISSRTFFRYFDSKEEAALLGQSYLLDTLDQAALSGATVAAALLEIHELMLSVLQSASAFETGDRERVMHLLIQQPSFRAALASQERALASVIRKALADHLPGEAPANCLAASELAVAAWRIGWRQWEEEFQSGTGRDPATVHREAWNAMRLCASEPR